MTESAADILSRGGSGGPSIGDFVGQVITVVDVEKDEGGKFKDNVVLTILDENAEEVVFKTTSAGVREKALDLKAAGHLPVEAKVVSGQGSYGKPWYDLNPA